MVEIVTALVILLTGIVSFWGAKKLHVGPSQELLVKTLQDVVDAQTERIKILEQVADEQRKALENLKIAAAALDLKIEDLGKIIIKQAEAISTLTV